MMNPEQMRVVDFLRTRSGIFVSVNEISKHLGNRRAFDMDRAWARPILRRMELEGIVESNPFGEYRLVQAAAEETRFKEALAMPGIDLGETTIVCLQEAEETETRANWS
jgi:hypothetical protein